MSQDPFDLLHPAVAHHIVNSLGWRSLRPLQSAAIEPILAGDHAIAMAPTAGGKTEAAFFPLLSRMLTDDWRGLSVLYVCPLRALLNNLHLRLEGYGRLVGRSVGLWHGDTEQPDQDRLLAEPPDVLLTTLSPSSRCWSPGVSTTGAGSPMSGRSSLTRRTPSPATTEVGTYSPCSNE